jgi:hypothetical protein
MSTSAPEKLVNLLTKAFPTTFSTHNQDAHSRPLAPSVVNFTRPARLEIMTLSDVQITTRGFGGQIRSPIAAIKDPI